MNFISTTTSTSTPAPPRSLSLLATTDNDSYNRSANESNIDNSENNNSKDDDFLNNAKSVTLLLKDQHQHHHQKQCDSSPSLALNNDATNVQLPFPFKLHQMLCESEIKGRQGIVSWQPDGKSFKVYNNEKFVKEVLPDYFNQTKYKSFTRQLYTYGFQRKSHGIEKGSYYHEKFCRDNRDLCVDMNRKKKPSQQHCHHAIAVANHTITNVNNKGGSNRITTNSTTSPIMYNHNQSFTMMVNSGATITVPPNITTSSSSSSYNNNNNNNATMLPALTTPQTAQELLAPLLCNEDFIKQLIHALTSRRSASSSTSPSSLVSSSPSPSFLLNMPNHHNFQW